MRKVSGAAPCYDANKAAPTTFQMHLGGATLGVFNDVARKKRSIKSPKRESSNRCIYTSPVSSPIETKGGGECSALNISNGHWGEIRIILRIIL